MTKLPKDLSEYLIIPPEIWNDPKLVMLDKCIIGRVIALQQNKGYCFAENKYFSDKFNKSIDYISKVVTRLVTRGYLSRELIRDNKGQIKQRKLVYMGVPTVLQDGTYRSPGRYPPSLEGVPLCAINQPKVPDHSKGILSKEIRLESNSEKGSLGDTPQTPEPTGRKYTYPKESQLAKVVETEEEYRGRKYTVGRFEVTKDGEKELYERGWRFVPRDNKWKHPENNWEVLSLHSTGYVNGWSPDSPEPRGNLLSAWLYFFGGGIK